MKKKIIKLFKNPLSLIGLVLVLSFIGIGISAPWLAPPKYPSEPYRIPRDGWSSIPKAPGQGHVFGTTEGQYDIFYGVIWGTRTAFRVSLLVVGLSSVIGVFIGTLAAFYGGAIDEVLMRIVDVFYSIPYLVAAMVLTAVLGRGLNNAMIALIAFGWMAYARLIRGNILSVKEEEYVSAADAVGAGDFRILSRHILPNSIFPVLIQASMNMGTIVIAAATLSFLGVGAPTGYADWGQMISFARNWILGTSGSPFQYWYTVVIPGIAITFFCLSWNLIGDAFRDIMDPKMQGGGV
ncbi:ABC transporter permease [Candidatus Bipolaricaulota bacterium]|nr:ABC transporter permease [Candidatus Bipolaricaulota bacterium]MBS3792943.1 ABC transporter permease [Candidatus Bipolaricaulota bacterium]